MNKSSIKGCIIAVLLAVLVPCLAYARPPHDTQTDCNTKCHQPHKTLGSVGYNNICMNCHRYGSSDPRYAQIYPYVITDQAKVEGPSLGVLRPKSMQSSHNWSESDYAPRVGALPPTDPRLLGPDPTNPAIANMFVGNLYCARCHSVHGNDGYADSVTPPFLRVPNDQDQMCLDCHRPRNMTTHEYGSHPVTVNYSSIAKSKPYEYFNPPVNTNPDNHTAAMQIKSGQVLCTTCHGVHHSDSNSRTFDNFSSVIFNGLSSSKGYLLRTDEKGVTSADRNICTNCHKTTDDPLLSEADRLNAKVKNHNGATKQQNIQCNDCHGGHVDEAVTDLDVEQLEPLKKDDPNVFLLKRYMQYSSTNGRTPKVIFLYTSMSKRNYNSNKFGVCLACHPSLPQTIEQHKETTASTCDQCHTHKAGFSANCTDCHGMPPREHTEGGPYGYAQGYNLITPPYLDESQTPHQSHAAGATGQNNYYTFSCNECHKAPQPPAPAQHGNGNFQDLFNSTNGTKAGIYASYDRTSRQCLNVYCHSNGLPANGYPAGDSRNYKTVSWGQNINSIIGMQPQSDRCNQCHQAVPTTNAHTKHLTNGLLNGCVNCHANTVIDNTTLADAARLTGGTHVNGYKDRRFSGTIGESILDGTTCATVYCHSDGKGHYLTEPVWSVPSTGACGTCHYTSNFPWVAGESHVAHLSATYGPNLNAKGLPTSPTYNGSCNYCHTYPTGHVDGSVTEPATATCTVSCHKTALPDWANNTRLACSVCHSSTGGNVISVIDGVSAPDKSAFASLGHGTKMINSVNLSCLDCHDQNAAHINTSVHDQRLKAELVNVNGAKNTECQYCHEDATKVANAAFRSMSTHFMPSDYNQPTATMACSQCHDIHGETTNKSAVKSTFAFINSTTWTVVYTNHTSVSSFIQPDGRGLCQVCHTQTSFYRAGATGQTHNSTTNCMTCHKHSTPYGAWAAEAGGCDGCHGYPPVPVTAVQVFDRNDPRITTLYKSTYGVQGNWSSAKPEDYIGGGGAHLNHVPDFARPDDGWSRCAVCHSAGSTSSPESHKMSALNPSTVTVSMDPAAKFNNALQIIYSGARLVVVENQTGSCMNIACHFQPSPRWSNYSSLP